VHYQFLVVAHANGRENRQSRKFTIGDRVRIAAVLEALIEAT
jgi:hypothetical protein